MDFTQIPFYILVVLTWLLMLVILVAAHELGHYAFARLFGMGAEEFSVGMFGKKPLLILGKRRYKIPLKPTDDPYVRGEASPLEGGGALEPAEIVDTPDERYLKETTVFTIRPWPLGGFVRIKGMMPQEDGGEINIPGGFFSKSPLKRWIVLAAGPAFSVLAGIILLIPYLMFYGKPDPSPKAVLGEMLTDSAAYKAGMGTGDRVVSIDGTPINTWYELTKQVRDSNEKPLHLVVERRGKLLTFDLKGTLGKEPTPVLKSDNTPETTRDKDGKEVLVLRRQTKLGAYPSSDPKPVAFGEAVQIATLMPVNGAINLVSMFARPKELEQNIGGPGTMVNMTAKSLREGFWPVIQGAAQISISLGIFNLLPIPPLDGGQMWIAFIEMLRRGRRLSMRTQVRVLNIGFAMVMVMVVGVLTVDFRRFTGLGPPPKISDEKR